MTQDQWTTIDDYYEDMLTTPDAALAAALTASESAGLPAHNVSPLQGKLLMLLAQMQGAKTILEVGTLGGYSTIWLARALPPHGRLITLELDPDHAQVARENIQQAGFAHQVEVRVGAAVDLLSQLADEGHTFDLVFIDADKQNNTRYVEGALRLTQPGAVIIVDNVIRAGAVADADSQDDRVQGVRHMNAFIHSEPRLDATAVQTVGSKGYDGFLLARVRSAPA